MQIAILGRQPKLSLAELECLFGAENIVPISNEAACVKNSEPLPQAQLGGTIKSAKLLTRLENTSLEDAFTYLQSSIPDHLTYLPEGKLQLGVSVYGFRAQKNWLLKQLLTLKKIIKKQGRSVRIIENKTEALEAAQVLYNKLTGPLGWEILIIKDGNDCLIARTTGVQNIDDYSKRDFDRPKRDAFVGMLPPKLAQIMINLANGKWQMVNGKPQLPQDHKVVLDPFCGTGVVLQEALLMGYQIIGTDISEKMVEYSAENLTWLADRYSLPTSDYPLATADATSYTWDFTNIQHPTSNMHIVCETYLGKPLASLPDSKKLQEIINEANTIAEGFLRNIAPQLKKGTRLCVALPAWRLGNSKFKHLPVLDPVRRNTSNGVDQISDMGYNRIDLKHATRSDLIYHRENQIVARELTILEKV